MPQPISLVICDDVIRDPRTGKVHLIGWASGLGVKSFPHVTPALTVFIGLTATTSTHNGQVILLAPAGHRIFQSNLHLLKFTTSTPSIWAVFRLGPIRFHTAGVYHLQLLCDNQLLTEREILVRFKGANGDV
jgi:hypothetical protein